MEEKQVQKYFDSVAAGTGFLDYCPEAVTAAWNHWRETGEILIDRSEEYHEKDDEDNFLGDYDYCLRLAMEKDDPDFILQLVQHHNCCYRLYPRVLFHKWYETGDVKWLEILFHEDEGSHQSYSDPLFVYLLADNPEKHPKDYRYELTDSQKDQLFSFLENCETNYAGTLLKVLQRSPDFGQDGAYRGILTHLMIGSHLPEDWEDWPSGQEISQIGHALIYGIEECAKFSHLISNIITNELISLTKDKEADVLGVLAPAIKYIDFDSLNEKYRDERPWFAEKYPDETHSYQFDKTLEMLYNSRYTPRASRIILQELYHPDLLTAYGNFILNIGIFSGFSNTENALVYSHYFPPNDKTAISEYGAVIRKDLDENTQYSLFRDHHQDYRGYLIYPDNYYRGEPEKDTLVHCRAMIDSILDQ